MLQESLLWYISGTTRLSIAFSARKVCTKKFSAYLQRSASSGSQDSCRLASASAFQARLDAHGGMGRFAGLQIFKTASKHQQSTRQQPRTSRFVCLMQVALVHARTHTVVKVLKVPPTKFIGYFSWVKGGGRFYLVSAGTSADKASPYT